MLAAIVLILAIVVVAIVVVVLVVAGDCGQINVFAPFRRAAQRVASSVEHLKIDGAARSTAAMLTDFKRSRRARPRKKAAVADAEKKYI